MVAQNRRAVYADGRAVMYGATDKADFRGIEGPEDQGVEVLFFWDGGGKLIATAVNVACPSQEVEGESTDRRRLLARGPRVAEGEARRRTSRSSAGRAPPATSRPT